MANPKLEILKAAVRKLAQEAEFTAKKQAADRAKKPIRNVSAREAAEVAREARKPIGGMSPIGRSRGSGNIPTREPNWAKNRNLNKVTVRQTEKKTAQEISKEKAAQAAAKKRQLEWQLKHPQAPKAGLKGVKSPKPSRNVGLTEYERNMRPKPGEGPVEAGEGLKARAAIDRREAAAAAQKEQEGRLEYQRQLRDSKINPSKTKSPAVREDIMQREADRRTSQGLREISAQEKKNAARTSGGITGSNASKINKLYRNRGD